MRGSDLPGLIRGAGRAPLIALMAAVIATMLLTALPWRSDGAATGQEERIASALARVEGAGRVRVLLSGEEEGGVLVIAEGADDIVVALKLARAVQTLLGVENSRIEVLKMEKRG